MTKIRTVSRGVRIGAFCLLAVAVAGTGLFAFQAPKGEEPGRAGASRPGAAPVIPPRRASPILRAKMETARDIVAQDMQRFRHGFDANVLREIPAWSKRLATDRLRLATTGAERVAAIREHRDRMAEIEKAFGEQAKAGQGSASDALKVKYFRLEADEMLGDEGEDVPAGPELAPMPGERRDGSRPNSTKPR